MSALRAGWRVANAAMALLFLFAVVVQYNDPDPLRWMAIYAVATVSCVAAAAQHRWSALIAAPTALIAAAWALVWRASMQGDMAPWSTLFEQFEMKDARVEETREVLGLVIVAVWCATIVVHYVAFVRRGVDGSMGEAD